MKKAIVKKIFKRVVWLEAVVCLACPSLAFAGRHKIDLHKLYGFKPGIPLAIVYADWRLTKPPTKNVPPFYVVPAYSPQNLPYNPNDLNTSPLEPPHGDQPSYWNNKPYTGLNGLQPPSYYLTAYQAGESSNPNLTNSTDKVGYGRAFALPPNGYTTAGNAPALMVNLPTGDRPADLSAIEANKSSVSTLMANSDASVQAFDPFAPIEFAAGKDSSIRLSATTRPSGTQPTTTFVATDKNPSVDQPTTDRSDTIILASAVAVEDSRHARTNLPMPTPSK